MVYKKKYVSRPAFENQGGLGAFYIKKMKMELKFPYFEAFNIIAYNGMQVNC